MQRSVCTCVPGTPGSSSMRRTTSTSEAVTLKCLGLRGLGLLNFIRIHIVSFTFSKRSGRYNKMVETQQQLQSVTDDYQKLQLGTLSRPSTGYPLKRRLELQSIVAARQKLESQQQENINVQKEFDGLAEDTNIFKLVGPVLLKQDRNEAVLAVKGRLDYIEKEM